MPYSTVCGETDEPPLVVNVIVNVFTFQTAFKVISSFTADEKLYLESPKYHPSNSLPSFVGSAGFVTVFPF